MYVLHQRNKKKVGWVKEIIFDYECDQRQRLKVTKRDKKREIFTGRFRRFRVTEILLKSGFLKTVIRTNTPFFKLVGLGIRILSTERFPYVR